MQLSFLKNGRLPLINISLVSDQSVNMIVISSGSISDTFEPFYIVLKCVSVYFIADKKNGKIISRIKIRL